MKAYFTGVCHIPAEQVAQNVAYCRSLNLPKPDYHGDRGPLAVVGGGHSVLHDLDTLRDWPGDIWACGSAYEFLRKNGIEATFFYVDPAANARLLPNGAKKAIVGTCCDKSIFDVLAGSEVAVFDLICTPEKTNHYVTTMTAAPFLALELGYKEITFFGADSCYEGGTTHAYAHNPVENSLHVLIDGAVYWTDIEFFMQAEFLAKVIRLLPNVLKEQSGGLLGAMVKNLDYDIACYRPMKEAA